MRLLQDLEEKQKFSDAQQYDLSGSILECMERYAEQLSIEQKEMIVECLEKGLTEEQIKRLMFRPVDEMRNYQRAYLLRNNIRGLELHITTMNNDIF